MLSAKQENYWYNNPGPQNIKGDNSREITGCKFVIWLTDLVKICLFRLFQAGCKYNTNKSLGQFPRSKGSRVKEVEDGDGKRAFGVGNWDK